MRSQASRSIWRMVLAFSLVLFAPILVSTAPALASYAGTFSDDDGSIHEPNIEAVAAAEITLGCVPVPLFCPDDPVTRAQMASFLARALDLPASPTDWFDDDNGSTHEDNINRIAEAGITSGCGVDAYCPNDHLTRAQMATLLVNALPGLDPATMDWFTDDDGIQHEANINVLRENEITLGCDVDLYCPTDSVVRAQMASFLARGLGLDPITPTPPEDNDPAWYTTPTPVGTGARIVNVPTSGSPTLEDALNDAQPGDRIVLASGVHQVGAGGNHVLSASGTPAAWIEIRGADGARPTIDLEGAGEFRISGSYVVLEHVEIINGGGNNLHIAPEDTDIAQIVVRDVAISDLSWGPGAAIKINRNNPQGSGVSHVYIEDCDVSEALDNAVIDGVGVERAVVRDCFIHDNDVGSHGIFFKGGSFDVLIERNVISGIRANAALQLGGNTGSSFFHPTYPDWEGVDQVARNNLITDFDDSAIEIRGVLRGSVHHNTIVTQSGFAIFRLQNGNNASGGSSDNDEIDIVNNLVIATGGDPQYARNDGSNSGVTFGRQLWAGALHNSGSPGPGVPAFPQAGDVVTTGAATVVSPSSAALTGYSDAIARFALAAASPAQGAGEPSTIVPRDILDIGRSETAPSIGAFEH